MCLIPLLYPGLQPLRVDLGLVPIVGCYDVVMTSSTEGGAVSQFYSRRRGYPKLFSENIVILTF